MQIVTDSGTDLRYSAEEAAELNIHIVPLNVTLDGETYREGIDIEAKDFYDLLEESDNLPITSQPSAGEFAELYRNLAKKDPDILSIHMTSGLSGTFNSALAGAELVPEANVTHFDTKTLSAVAGWQVEAAARASKAGWAVDRVLQLAKKIGDACESIYTLDELKYLIHGGRISHMKGVIASLIKIKPMIGVEKENGTYIQLGMVRSFKGAIMGLVNQIKKKHAPGSELRVQVLHAFNPDGASMLREQIDKIYKCDWLPMGPMSLVLGAHTGPSMIGVGFGPKAVFDEIP
ncbi:MAG: DegV family protein [Anaerolineales bacterium]|nr:DegV family protein [Anaerolineales bacterium]